LNTQTLTTSADGGANFTGGAGADTFNAVIGTDGLVANGTTFNPGDNLNGGAGADTLAISVSGTHGGDLTVAAVTLAGIETITVSDFQTADGSNTIIDLSIASGVTTIAKTSSSASGDTFFTGVQAIVAAKMQNGAGDLGITYAAAAVAGTADTQALELSAVTAGTFTVTGVETLAITSAGSTANVLTGITTAAGLTKYTVAGTQNVTLGTLAAAVVTVDASASTAGIIATAGQAVDYVITGGGGNDVLTVTAGNVTAADTITGGNGTDTIRLGANVTAADAANITGFEVLEVTTNAAAGQTMAGFLTGVTKLVSSADAAANNVSFTNVAATVTDLQVTGTEGVIAALAVNTAADAVTLTYGTATAGFTVAGAGQTTLNDYEAISIVSQGAANNTGAFSATSLTTLNASGSQALTIGAMNAGNTAVATINAGAMTANFVMTNNVSTTASTITGGSGNDTLFGSTRVDSIVGGVGNDVINGGAGADVLDGGAGNDTFNVTTVTHFTTGVETVIGGAGNDTLSIAQDATITTITAANLGAISGIETLSINSGAAAASVTLTDAVFTANGQALSIVDADLTTAGGTLTVNGSALTAANAISVTANTATGINDTLTGGAGNDTFTFSDVAGLEATDTVVGGAGTDTIFLTATTDVTAVMTGVRTVENVTTTGTGGDIIITVGGDLVIAASSTLTVNAASSTTTGNTLTYDGSAVTIVTKVQNVTGSAGADSITGGSGNDIISGGDGADQITGGVGVDNLSGGAGDDVFIVGTAAHFTGLAAAEIVSGSAGTDTLRFAAGLTPVVAAADLVNISSIEKIETLNVANNFGITLTDAVFTANGNTSLIIDATTMTTGDLIVAASALTAANSVTVEYENAGVSDDSSIVLGAGNDTVMIAVARLGNVATITGGTGTDTLTLSTTGATVTMAATITGFEAITFAADLAANITTVDANVASGVTFTVNGAPLITTNALTFNGVAELDGKFSITGGNAADVLTGGSGADTITAGGGADSITGGIGADNLTGGAEADTFIYTLVTHSTGTTADTITDFTTTSDKLRFTLDYNAVSAAVDVNSNLVATVGDLSAKRGEFVYDSTAGTLSVNVNNDNLITTQDYKVNVGTVVAADVNFTITGSAFGDTLAGGAGVDAINGGAGTDLIQVLTTTAGNTDTIDGGAQADTLELTGASHTFATDGNLTNVETITLISTASVTLTGQTETFTITGSTGNNAIIGGNAADTITTGGGADTVTGGGAADSITGGGGVDIVRWTATTAALFATETGSTAGTNVTVGAGVGDAISTWVSATDKLHFAAAAVTNAIGVETDTLLSIVKGGTVTNVARFVHITNTVVGDAVDTGAGAVTVLNGLTTAAVAIGDGIIVAMANDTNTYLYYVKQVSAADTIAAQDVTLIGVVNGITTLANGDFVSF